MSDTPIAEWRAERAGPPSPARATVRVLRSRRFDGDLQANVLSVWGYRAECPCEWRGKAHAVMSAARRELREHLDSEYDGNQPKGEHG